MIPHWFTEMAAEQDRLDRNQALLRAMAAAERDTCRHCGGRLQPGSDWLAKADARGTRTICLDSPAPYYQHERAAAGYVPGDEHGPGRPGAAALRIGDAERDAAARRLQDSFAAGQLTRDELDERMSQALGARTGSDLARILADLGPAREPERRPDARAGEYRSWDRGDTAWLSLVALLAVLLILWALGGPA